MSGWRFFTDAVMGGLSSGGIVDGKDGPHCHVRMTGKVTTANNGGFIQMQKRLEASLHPETTGVRLIARGNGQLYFVHVRSSQAPMPRLFWRTEFVSGSKWQEIRLPFSAFKPSRLFLPAIIDPETIVSVAVVAYGRDHLVDVSILDLGFF